MTGRNMAYFTKEEYQRKTEYACGVSEVGVIKLALALATKDSGFKYSDLEDAEISKKLRLKVEPLITELQPIAYLSHARHEIHSTPRTDFLRDDSEVHQVMDRVGTKYSYDISLVDEVNELNKKYQLVDAEIPCISCVEIMTSVDSTEEILENYGKEISDNEEKNEALARDLLFMDWDEKIESWSNYIKEWFGKLNQKFGTNFPATISQEIDKESDKKLLSLFHNII